MSALAEVAGIAIALYFWESLLWIPLSSVALRHHKGKWKVLDPRKWFSIRRLGVIPMLPIPPDLGLAPCCAPALTVDAKGKIWLRRSSDTQQAITAKHWDDISSESNQLYLGPVCLRLPSARPIQFLKRSKNRGTTFPDAVDHAWRLSLSPARAGREWKRWKLVSRPLCWMCPLLTIGFFAGLPLSYINLEPRITICLALWLWSIMVMIAIQLVWIGKRAYPDARGSIHMDAFLCLLIPFHAMRAREIISTHAFCTTHQAALMLHTHDFDNRWLCSWVRELLYPLPNDSSDGDRANATLSLLSPLLAGYSKSPKDFDRAPAGDEDGQLYCPRCHSLYQAEVSACSDCGGLPLHRIRE